MTARDHLKKYPNARPSTIAYLVQQDKMNEQLRREVRKMRLRRIAAYLWPFPSRSA